MITIRHGNQRGQADFGWLNSKHSFSFGNYYDENYMGFSALRVINDDKVTPGAGFQTHGHSDMEILSYVLEGSIAHKDSQGNVATLPAGEFQLMSAGSGIRHSEFNPSATEPLHFLQIWIEPNVYGETPGYQQKNFGQEEGLTLVVSPDGEQGSLVIKQDVKIYQLTLKKESSQVFSANKSRNYYLHLIAGEVVLGEAVLTAGDGAKIEKEELLHWKANSSSRALLFDLP